MADREPGDRPATPPERRDRQLDRAPGERYLRAAAGNEVTEQAAAARRAALFAPVVKAVIAAAIGTVVLYALGALLSSSAGLVFVAGFTGAMVGLLLARAAARSGDREPPLTRRAVTWSAVALTVLAIALASLGTWLHALAEGGALGPIDYLLQTFGVIVPAELVIAGIAAAWGAAAGPIER
jgi:hypothetical protein